MSLANRFGAHVLPFMNPRVVCPPGTPVHHERPNIVIASPMRSGTHVLIDLVLNNVPAYRTRPLYVDLDQCRKQSVPGRDLVGAVRSDAGHVVKTHLPIGVDAQTVHDPQILRILDAAVVVTVRRDFDAISASLAQWDRSPEQLKAYRDDYDAFWSFWSGRAAIEVGFAQLFDVAAARDVVGRIARAAGAPLGRTFRPCPSAAKPMRIYLDKGLTRAAGRHAPRVNTTIHTLKR